MFALLRILAAWLGGDRVRASPREGRLLRLQPGGCVRIDGESCEVVSRRPALDGTLAVTYGCRGVAVELSLDVSLSNDGTVRATVSRDGITRIVSEREIDCFG